MSISERAINGSRLAPAEMPEKERPISEEYRIAAKEWVAAKKGFRLLEEMKKINMARMKNALMQERGKMLDAQAERLVLVTDEWAAIVNELVEAETACDYARVKMKWIELRYGEWQSDDANARKERHMGRQAV